MARAEIGSAETPECRTVLDWLVACIPSLLGSGHRAAIGMVPVSEMP
jgi:hypothetical protein